MRSEDEIRERMEEVESHIETWEEKKMNPPDGLYEELVILQWVLNE